MAAAQITHPHKNYYWGLIVSTAIFSFPSLLSGMVWVYFITPLPVIYYLSFHGFERGIKIITHAVLISGGIAMLLGTLPVLLFSLSLLPVGYILAKGLSRHEQIQYTALTAIICLGLIWLAAGLLIGSTNKINLYTEIINNIDVGLAGAYEAYSQLPDFPAEAQPELLATFTKFRELVPKIFPGVLITSTIYLVLMNVLLANWLLKLQGRTGWDNFKTWRLPELLVWPLIVAGIAVYFTQNAFNILGLNTLIVLGTLYFIQGLAVLATLFSKWPVPAPIKFFIIFFLIIQAYGVILLALLGLADIWIDFSKKNDSPE